MVDGCLPSLLFFGQVIGAVAVVFSLGGCAQTLENGGLGAMLQSTSGSSDITTGSLGKNASGEAHQAEVKAVIARARGLQADGEGGRALTTLAKAHAKAPKNAELLIAYARTAVEQGQGKLAFDIATRAQPGTRNAARLLSVKGAALAMMGRDTDAHKAFADALEKAPNDPDLLNNLAMSHALKGNVRTAETLLRKAAGQTQDKKVHQNLALVLGLQGRFGKVPGAKVAQSTKAPAAGWGAKTKTMLGGPSN